jgi:Tol biopolymer transport system component
VSSSGGRPRLLRRILGTTALVSRLVWSPDSRRLVSAETHGLFLIDLDSGRARLVAGTAGGGVTYLSFAPDGHAIVYELNDWTGPETGPDLYIYDLARNRARRITYDHRAQSPVWGAHAIAFKRGRSRRRGDVWLVDSNGRHLRRLTHIGAGIYPAAWSADGARLLAANLGDNGRLWAVDAHTGHARTLTGWVRGLFSLGLSRDGSTILASVGCSDPRNFRGVVETVPFAGGKARVIVNGPCYANWNR